MAIHDLNIWGKKKKKETYTRHSISNSLLFQHVSGTGWAALYGECCFCYPGVVEVGIPGISALVPALKDLCLQQQREYCNKSPWLKAGWDADSILQGSERRKSNPDWRGRAILRCTDLGLCIVLFEFPSQWLGMLSVWALGSEAEFRLIAEGMTALLEEWYGKEVKIKHLPLGTVGVLRLKRIFGEFLLSGQKLSSNLWFEGLNN